MSFLNCPLVIKPTGAQTEARHGSRGRLPRSREATTRGGAGDEGCRRARDLPETPRERRDQAQDGPLADEPAKGEGAGWGGHAHPRPGSGPQAEHSQALPAPGSPCTSQTLGVPGDLMHTQPPCVHECLDAAHTASVCLSFTSTLALCVDGTAPAAASSTFSLHDPVPHIQRVLIPLSGRHMLASVLPACFHTQTFTHLPAFAPPYAEARASTIQCAASLGWPCTQLTG